MRNQPYFDPKPRRYPFPELTNQHYLVVKKDRGVLFDEKYPYIDHSKAFLRKQWWTRLLLRTIVFPMTNKSFIGFSNDRKSFNENYNDMNFRIGGGEVYEMYTRNANDKSFSIAEIPCDIVRIYHPHNKKELK
jgi:hypothetical protein